MVTKEYQVQNPQRTDAPLSEAVLAIDAKLRTDPENAELWMQRGLALADQRLMREAVEAYSKAISIDPFCGIFYRHRAHRYLSCWRFQDACADFTVASRLIPDNWDVWYHLGLSHYLLGEYEQAAQAYARCCELTNTDDKLIAVTDWYWMTLGRLGRHEEAERLLEGIRRDMDYGGNLSYYRRLQLYKGWLSEEELAQEIEDNTDPLEIVTRGYGLSNYFRLKGDLDRADKVADAVLRAGRREMWSAFGFLAAMVDRGCPCIDTV